MKFPSLLLFLTPLLFLFPLFFVTLYHHFEK